MNELVDYGAGLARMLHLLGYAHRRYQDVLVLQARLTENIGQVQLYGDTETRRAERAQIIHSLNKLAVDELDNSFNKLCDAGTSLPPLESGDQHVYDFPPPDLPNSSVQPWVRRTIAGEIYDRVIQEDRSIVVYLIVAPGGIGKTFLARDIGSRLGSPTGYERVRKGRLVWSGILDLYDPEANSHSGLDQRLIQILLDEQGETEEYEEYMSIRDHYFLQLTNDVHGTEREQRRQMVEDSFLAVMRAGTKHCRPIIAIDSIERIESETISTRQSASTEDTSSVMGWLTKLITRIPNCVWILLGRQSDEFIEVLQKNIAEANRESVNGVIQLQQVQLGCLDDEEVDSFYRNRIQFYPILKDVLSADLQAVITQLSGRNPLLLDLALQTLIESKDATALRDALSSTEGGKTAEQILVEAYLKSLRDPDQRELLSYLAMARNGLFTEMLDYLDPLRAETLAAKLECINFLPLTKVRMLSVGPGEGTPQSERRTFFLHDTMYFLCDAVMLRRGEVAEFSQRVANWYDHQLTALRRGGLHSNWSVEQRRHFEHNLLVESLFYRMRAAPEQGYHWYLQQEDEAIRNAQLELDMRLQTALRDFLRSASPSNGTETAVDAMYSPIDQHSVSTLMPTLFDDARLDNEILWIKRYTLRGKRDKAAGRGHDSIGQVTDLYLHNPGHYLLAYAEFLLWYAQSIMYGGKIGEALPIYLRVIDILSDEYNQMKLETARYDTTKTFEVWRATLVLGRTYNNLGYCHWMYEGKLSCALSEFQKAIHLFRLGRLTEELANSSDNMGRVYAQRGEGFRAITLIKEGLQLRARLGYVYRQALSLNSLAIALTRLEREEIALEKLKEALKLFSGIEVERGLGLGLLTRGITYRNMAETWREMECSLEKALEYCDLAESDLKEAAAVFSQTVREPIREVWALNELACTYRARYLLLARAGYPAPVKERARSKGKRIFQKAIKLARKYAYEIEELDSLQDTAVLLTRSGNYVDAENHIQHIRTRIPDHYRIRAGMGLRSLDAGERVDMYYKLLGQVELLAGAIAFEYGRRKAGEDSSSETPKEEGLVRAAHHYLLATAYFYNYAGHNYAFRMVYGRVYERFRPCSPEQIHSLAERCKQWIEEYCLLPETVRTLTVDVFGML